MGKGVRCHSFHVGWTFLSDCVSTGRNAHPPPQGGPTVGAFCRKALSPQGEPCVHIVEDRSLRCFIADTQVAASREALLGKEGLQMLPFRVFCVFRG